MNHDSKKFVGALVTHAIIAMPLIVLAILIMPLLAIPIILFGLWMAYLSYHESDGY